MFILLSYYVHELTVTGRVSSRICGDQNRCFKQKRWSFTNPNQVVFVSKPNETMSTVFVKNIK